MKQKAVKNLIIYIILRFKPNISNFSTSKYSQEIDLYLKSVFDVFAYLQLSHTMTSKEIKFLKIYNKVDSKMMQNVITSSKELSSSQKVSPIVQQINSQSSNPFILHPFPPITIAQIPAIIICLAQSVQENSIKNLSLCNLQRFVGANEDALVRFFIQKSYHCHLFCLAFIRYFQECSKTKELAAQISKAQLLPFVILFSAILQKRRLKKISKPVKSQQKQINNQIHTIFIALTFATCARFLIQSEQQHIQGNCIQKALFAACLMAEQGQNQAQFQSLREFLTVSSYLLIFNGTAMRPQNLLQFSLNNDHRIYLGKEQNQQLNSAIVLKFMRCLNVYSKKDNRFSEYLIKIAKNLLTLSINNTILLSLFEVLVELMRLSSVSSLKKQVFEVLIQNHIKRNIAIIDQIFIYILGSGIDLLEDETQRYLLTLAEAGDMKRKQRFAIIYYDQYQKSFNKVQEPIINFIFEIYLQLGLKIQKMELMIAKEALIISKSNISKLHSCIRYKNDYIHINILSIILEKRKDNFEVSKKASPHPFICEQWLQNAGQNPQIYKTYTKIIAQTLCGKTIDVEPSMINLNKIIVKVSFDQHSQIQGQYLVRSLEFYSILLKMALKCNVFEEITFRYMILLQSLLGDKLPLVSYAYFSKNVSKIVSPQSTFLTYLEYLVTLLKNKSSVLLYLQAVLEFQMNLTKLFFDKKLYDISFLARLIQEQFFRLSSYSFESMTVIYQLSLVVTDQSFQEDYLKIMKYWSSIMTRSQCKNLTYFFAFRQIKKIYPFMKQRQLKNPSDRIKSLWNLILNLIDQHENKRQYIHFSPNKLIISWKGDQNIKKDIKISGNFLRNPSMQQFWHFQIKTTQKVYYVSLKDYKVLIQSEQIKHVNRQIVEFRQTLKQNKIIQLKKRPQSIQFMLKLENQTKKTVFQFSIMEKLLYTLHFDGNIQSITLQCKNNAILKEINIIDMNQNAQINQISEHIHYLNQWLIKVSSLTKYYLHDFQQKFDFSHAYCCIGQMLKHFSHVTIPFAYDIFIRLSTRLIKFIHNKERKQLMQVMLQVFNTIQAKYSSLRGRNKTLNPIIQIQNLKLYGKQLYYLFTTAIMPYTFWNNFSQKTKRDLVEQLKKILIVQTFKDIQNTQLTFFNQALDISLEDDFFYEICDLALNVHQFNQVLTMKFNKFIHISKDSSIFSNYFNSFLDKNLKYLNIQNEKFVQNRLRCKFLVMDSQRIKQIFTFCTVTSKIDIFHYLSQNPSFDNKGRPNSLHLIKQLMQRVDLNQKYEVMPWLIIEIKQLINRLKMKTFQESKYNFRVTYLHLEILLLNRNACHEDQKDQIEKFVLDLLKILKNDMKVEKFRNELQYFIISNIYIDYLIEITKELLGKGNNINKIQKSTKLEIYEFSLNMITKFQKRIFLQFLIKYRYKCSHQGKLLKALIDIQQFKGLKLSHFSIFLQFILQVLILLQQRFIFSQQQTDSIVVSITEYIEYIVHTLDNKTKIAKSLFYSFPHIFGQREGMKDINKIIRRMNRACQKVDFLQLRGGVYFKCMLIVIKMMKLRIHLDYSNLAEYFIFGPKKMGKLSSSQQSQLFSIKQRSLAQTYMADAVEQHKLYFTKQDNPYSNQNQEFDLNSHIPDYFLMNLADYLQQKAQIIDQQLLKKYTNIFLLGCSNQKINRQFLLSNNENAQIHNYDDITKLIEQDRERSSSDASSPVVTLQRVPSTPQKFDRSYEGPTEIQFSSERDVQFYGSPPKKSSVRKKTADFTSEHKKRTQMLELIREDYRNWYKIQTSRKIPSYFSEKAKQIRVVELLHTHFVLKNSLFMSKITTASKIKEKYDTFNKIYSYKLEQQKKNKLGSQALEDKIRKVKKIHPYTSSKSPVLNIIQNCFGFMTSPITVKITKVDYRIKRLKSQESMNQKFYLHSKESQQSNNGITNEQSNESPTVSLGKISSLTEQVIQVQEQQTYITKQKPYCQLITREGAYFCQYHLENTCLVLSSKMERHICQNLWYLKLGTPDDNLIHTQIKVQIYPQEVHEIFFRRFNQITNNSLQFFMKNGTSRFISFYRRQSLTTLIKHLEKVFKGVKIIKDPLKQFEDAKFSQRWIEGHFSNFDYLMLLNKYSGRSYNDLNQYYVFPWILKDYHSDKIDLTNPDVYRDLDKPIGALNPQKLRRYKEKYRNQAQFSERCLYGSHYSASLIIFYYLVRLEPFSSLHRQMQKGTWDVADRLFNSIGHVWESLMSETSSSDIKQCTPEFYYLPAFLRNIANIDLGQKQCGTDVGDVQLPPWAENAEQFILTLRAALESDHVSENLHSWIDLIFGKHQNSEQKHNIFHPYSYSDPQVLLKINTKNHKQLDGIICQISYFGQCPIQLFRKQHKPKKIWGDLKPKSIKSIQTGANSESTSSQKFWGEASIPSGWKVNHIVNENTDFILQLKHITRSEKQTMVVSAFAKISVLKQNVQTLIPYKKIQQKHSNQIKITINNNKQVMIGKEFLVDLDFKFNFEHTQVNQLWIACFGVKGLKILNWQLQQSWSWELEEVMQVNLEPTRLIFSIPSGKLFFYSFLQKKLQQTIVFKDVYDMKIKVMCLPRLPARQRNQITYKILCIGDGTRLSIVSYTFEQIMNYTSQSRCSKIQ